MSESIVLEVLSVSVAGAFSASALYPLEVLKTKMQAEESSKLHTVDEEEEESNQIQEETNAIEIPKPAKKLNMMEYAERMYQKEGLAPFYTGIGTSAFQSSVEKALYFFAYTGLKNAYCFITKRAQIGTVVNLILGCMAEWAHLPITLPMDCWKTQIQTGKNGKKAPLVILMTMLNQGDGIRGMYKGIQAYTVLCLKPAIQYTVYEQVKKMILARKRRVNDTGRNSRSHSLSTVEVFLLGMVARTIATLAVYPYLRAKVMLQSSTSEISTGDKTKPNISAMILQMYANGGLAECFQGIGPELTRGVLSAALMLTCKERIDSIVKRNLKM